MSRSIPDACLNSPGDLISEDSVPHKNTLSDHKEQDPNDYITLTDYNKVIRVLRDMRNKGLTVEYRILKNAFNYTMLYKVGGSL